MAVKLKLTIMTFFLFFINAINADDTDLFVTILSDSMVPNVLIMVDNSISMKEIAGGRKRMDIAKDGVDNFLDNASDINISLMSFAPAAVPNYNDCQLNVNTSDGGQVDFASQNIETGRASAKAVVSGYYHDVCGTPLTETFYETYLYFAGLSPKYGGSVTAAMTGSDFLSPTVTQCQKNNIIIFTDGGSWGDTDSDPQIRVLISGLNLPSGLSASCSGDGGCVDELAWFMSNHDVNPHLTGQQSVTTYTIGGFGAAPPDLLTSVANYGGGEYYEADDSGQLTEVLSDILLRVHSESSSFAAPATSVSAFNSLETAEDVYYIVFKPELGPGWKGNLKRYRLGDDNNLYDADGNLAIDPDTGFFSETAKSFWSSSADGKIVETGGMVEQLTQGRPVFTSVTGDTSVTLSSTGNRLHESNSNITSVMLNTADSAETDSVLQWARGVDVDDEDSDGSTSDDRTSIGDPMHTQPQVVTYYKNSTGSFVDKTVFFTTNDGFLHAVNADDGTTEFSFIPEELLGNLKTYKDGFIEGGVQKVYGMDGPMTAWINDDDDDGDVLSANNGASDSGDHVYLYLTMRRGGNNIYALDVTDRSNPILRWVIRGDVDNDHHTDTTGDFSRLGQTWSTPKLAKVNWNGSLRQVLLFGGGYDVAIDGHTTIQNSNIGNAVFMVDAITGGLLWRASNNNSDLNIADMVYSIPAELTPLDIDQDGAIDVIFGGDTGGQIFRMDINQNNTGASDFATGGVIAKLAGTSAADARRFFEPVTVALGKDSQYLNIAVGSGYRPAPLSTDVNDRVYVLRDSHVTQPPANYSYTAAGAYTESHLYNASNNLIQQGTSSQQTSALTSLTNSKGWFIELEDSGEKVLGRAVIHNGVLLINSFAPIISSSTSCSPGSGVNYLYSMNIENGGAIFNFDTVSSDLGKMDRRQLLKHTTLAPEPSIVSRGTQGGEICVGTECFQDTLSSINTIPVIRRYWRENR